MAELTPSKRPRLLVFRAKKRGPQTPLDPKGEARRNWRKLRSAQGLCADCPNTLDRKGILCSSCVGKMKGYYKRRRAEMRRLGLCFVCRTAQVDRGDFMCGGCRDQHASQSRDTLQRLKTQVYRAYGNRCSCCGESNEGFFTIDHVNGDGAQHRIQVSGKNSANQLLMYRWIIRNGYPKTLRLYCYNCNIGSYRNGGTCPHTSIQKVVETIA